MTIITQFIYHSFKIKTGIQLTWKKQGKKNPVWPGDPVKNLVAIRWFFLLKRCYFNFKKKIDSMTRSKLGTRILNRTGCKNYEIYHFLLFITVNLVLFFKEFIFKNILNLYFLFFKIYLYHWRIKIILPNRSAKQS